MSVHKSGEVITANGDYEFTVIPGRKYLLEPYWFAGTATVAVASGIVGLNYDKYQGTQEPNSTTDITITASGKIRSYEIKITGNRIRLGISSASSLVMVPMLTLSHPGS